VLSSADQNSCGIPLWQPARNREAKIVNTDIEVDGSFIKPASRFMRGIQALIPEKVNYDTSDEIYKRGVCWLGDNHIVYPTCKCTTGCNIKMWKEI